MQTVIRYLPGLILCLCLGSALAQPQPQPPVFTVGQTAGDPAATLELPIDVSGEFAAAQFDLVLSEPRLSLDGFNPAALPAGLTLDSALIAPDHLRVVLYQTACPEPTAKQSGQGAGVQGVAGGQRLGQVVVTIASDAEPGNIAVALAGLKAVDEAAAPLVVRQVEGQIAIRGGGVPPAGAIPVPTLPFSGLLAMFALLLVAGLVVLHRRGVNVLLVLVAAGLVLATQPQPAAAQRGGGGGDAASIVEVILERQGPDGSEDCNGDGLVDVGDVICARNMACEAGQNQPPVIAAIADQSLTVGESFSLQVQASDPDLGDTLSFTLTTAPAGMLIDASGLITWTPSSGDLGDHTVTVTVTDPESLSDDETFIASVFAANNDTVTLFPPGNYSVVAGDILQFQLYATASDPAAVLTFSKQSGPANLTVNASSGEVSWTTSMADIGIHSVQLRVTDQNSLFDEKVITIEVTEPPDPGTLPNRAPVLQGIADHSIMVGQNLSVQTSASDPDSDPLTYQLLAAPGGMSIDASGLISFTPGVTQAGVFEITVRVSDPLGLSDTQSFTLKVNALNGAPQAVDDGYDAQKGSTLTVVQPGVLQNDTDPDGDPLTVSLLQGPEFGSLNLAADGSFEYTPDNPAGTITAVQKLRYAPGNSPIEQPLIMDMDGNGIPDIVYHTFSELGAVQGDTGLEIFEIKLDRALWHDKAIADIDLDGRPEIVLIGGEDGRSGTQYGRKMIALEHDGQLKWISEAVPEFIYRDDRRWSSLGGFNDAKVSIADLDQDGTPEILVGWGYRSPVSSVGYSVFDNQGMLLDTVHAEGIKSSENRASIEVVDLDLDGDPEIVTGSVAFSHDGELLWARNDIKSNGKGYHNLIAVNLDDDPYPELVRRTETGFGMYAQTIMAWNHDGTDLWQANVPYVTTSEPLIIADVNSDGQVDIVSASGTEHSVTAVNGLDGSILWSVEVSSGNRFTAPTVLDLDGDGFNEVVYPYGQDPTKLLILDGRDGSVKLEQDLFDGLFGSVATMPIFADIDADGASELILMGHQVFGGNSVAFYVYESENDDWPPLRGIWNQWNFHVTNINTDGSIPQFEQPHWLLPGLNQNRINERLPEEREENFDQFTYRASDGTLSDDASVYLRVLTNSNPPQFLTQPDTTATVGFVYRYAPIVTDPDPGESFTFTLTAAPAGMSIDAATGLISWGPAVTGAFNVGVVVTDSADLSAAQTWSLVVGEPVEVPDVVGLTQASASATLDGVNLKTGRIIERNDPIRPIGEVAIQNPPAGSVAEFGAEVDLTVSIGPAPADFDDDNDTFTENEGDCNDADNTIFPGAADPEGDGIDQNCDGVDGELALESIVVEPQSSILLSNTNIQFSADGIRADGTAINLTALGNWASSDPAVASIDADGRARTMAAGQTTISLSYQGVTGQATIDVVTGVSSDVQPPTADIQSPISGTEVTAPVDVIGSADDANLLRWELSLISGDEASETGSETLLAVGTSSVNNGMLGQLDPTLLLNGIYTLQLSVYDRGSNLTVARTVVEVTEQYKIGNFTLTFEDLNVDLAGLPITVSRSYDSRDKRRGDFGIGWALGLKAVDIRANRILGTGWEALKSGNSFQLNPTDDHMLSVTLPGGEVETFELQIDPASSFLLPFSFVEASVTPTGNTLGELEILDNTFLLIIDGQPGPVQLLDDSSFDVFNPQRFRYTAPNGLEFVVHRSDGLEQFSDGNGNALTFTDAAIIHSNGTQVSFQRDGLDRITRLTDPEGNQQHYGYDSSGNLASHTDAEGNISRFRYNRDHGLLEVIDPRGNRAVRNEYDNDGRLIVIIDAEGNRVEFTHDIDGREELIRDANGNIQRLILNDEGDVLVRERTVTIDGVPTVAIEQFQYDARGNEIVRIDADGRRTELTYDAEDNLLQTVVDPGGLNITTSNTYDSDGNRLTETDALGRVTSFTYDADDNLLTITDPMGNVQSISYAGGGKIATRTDALGTVTSYSYNSQGALLGEDVTAADGTLLSRKTFTYNNNGKKTSESVYRIIDGVLTPLTTTFAYDANNRLITTTDALGNISRAEYDAAGNIAARIDALGRRTEFSYSPRGQQILTTHHDGNSTSQAYDGAGNVISRTDELGRVTTFEFDELSRQIAVVHPDGAREEEVLSAGGRLLASIDARGNRTEYSYDAAGRRIGTISPAVIDARDGSTVNPTVTQSYDAAGNVLTSTDANGNTTAVTYDNLNRPVRTDSADGSFTTQSFDAVGRVVASTDELGRITTQSYDGAGRLLSITQPAPTGGAVQPVTTYSWDMTGNRLTQIDALGRTTRISYDRLNRQTRRTLPGGQFATASYDAVGNRIVQTDFNGDAISITVDARNRTVTRTLPDGEVQNFTYTASGALLTATDAEGTQSFERDARDRTTAIIQPDGSRLEYSFDVAGNLTQLLTPAQTINYSYDALNRTTQVTSDAGTTAYGYDPNGNQVQILRPNLAVTETTYDARNRIAGLTHRDATATVLESFTNTYLANGLRASVTEMDGSVESYGYDDLNRLISETRTGANPRSLTYSHDEVGNRTSVDRDGSVTAYSYDINNRLLSAGPVSYTFDANGNRTSAMAAGNTTLLNWNAENQLVSVDANGSQTTYRYDINGNRTSVQNATGEQRFLVDPQSLTGYAQVAETRDGNGNLLTSYTYGTDLISADNGLPSYYHADAHGSTRLLTSATAQATDSYVYDGYGNLSASTGSSDNDYLYAGEQFDEDANAYYLRARYYDPDTGIFLSRDPFVGNINNPVTQHSYLYASADPINNLDPTGQFSVVELSQSLSLIGQQVAVRVQPFCQALARAQVAEGLVAAANLGYALSAGNNVAAGIKVDLPGSFEPYDSVGFGLASKPPNAKTIKFALNVGEDTDNSEKGQSLAIAASATVQDRTLVAFNSTIEAGIEADLAKVKICGLITLATISTKLELTAEAGASANAGTYTGTSDGVLGGKAEGKQRIIFKTGGVETGFTLYTVRSGGSNPGLFPGDG